MGFLETVLLVSITVVVVSLASTDDKHHRRSYTVNPGKVSLSTTNWSKYYIFLARHFHSALYLFPLLISSALPFYVTASSKVATLLNFILFSCSFYAINKKSSLQLLFFVYEKMSLLVFDSLLSVSWADYVLIQLELLNSFQITWNYLVEMSLCKSEWYRFHSENSFM